MICKNPLLTKSIKNQRFLTGLSCFLIHFPIFNLISELRDRILAVIYTDKLNEFCRSKYKYQLLKRKGSLERKLDIKKLNPSIKKMAGFEEYEKALTKMSQAKTLLASLNLSKQQPTTRIRLQPPPRLQSKALTPTKKSAQMPMNSNRSKRSSRRSSKRNRPNYKQIQKLQSFILEPNKTNERKRNTLFGINLEFPKTGYKTPNRLLLDYNLKPKSKSGGDGRKKSSENPEKKISRFEFKRKKKKGGVFGIRHRGYEKFMVDVDKPTLKILILACVLCFSDGKNKS